jgi:hypothetical protein
MPEGARRDLAAEPAAPAGWAPSRRAAGIAVAVLVAIGLMLRLNGLGFQLPQFVPLDSLVLSAEVDVLRHGGDPAYRIHPNLYPQLIPRLVLLLPGERADEPAPNTLEEHLARARAPYLRVNLTIALLSLIAVPGTYLLARRFMERSWAVVASGLIATSVLHLWFSQQGRPHSAAMSFTLLAVLAALRVRRRPSLPSYLLAGAAVGLAVGALQSGVATLLPFAAAFLLRERPVDRVSPALAVTALAIVVAAIVCFYPLAWGGRTSPGSPAPPSIGFDGSTLSLMGHAMVLQGFNGRGTRIVLESLWSYDPLILGMAAAGLAWAGVSALRRHAATDARARDRARRDDRLVVLAYCVPYLIVICLYENSTQRFAIPLLPFMACLAAYALRALWRFACAHGSAMQIATTFGMVAIVAVQSAGACKLSWIRSRADTATQAADWVRAHLRPARDKIVLTPGFDLPLLETAEVLKENEPMRVSANQRWFRYQLSLDPTSSPTADRYDLLTLPVTRTDDRARFLRDPVDSLRSLHAAWIVMEVHRTWDWGGLVQLRTALMRQAALAARFSPDSESRWGDVPIAHQGYDPLPFPIPWFRRILGARSTGSVIEIWKLPE